MANVVVEMSGDEGKLWKSYQKIIDQSKKLDESTRRNKASHESAFGASAVSGLLTYAGAAGAAATVLNSVKRVLTDIRQTADEMAAKHKGDFLGLGSLAQLAESVPEMRKLIAESKASFAQGAATTLGSAAQLQFAITSAGMDKYRQDVAELQASGTVSDASTMVNAAAAMLASMGEAETGDFRALVSKAFGASKGAPASAEAIMQAAAMSGPQAKALGMSDEQVLAGIATLAKPAGSAEQAGTLLEAFLKQVEKEGVGRKKLEPGRSLSEYVGDIAALEDKGRSVRNVLGNRQEAITAYRLLREGAATYQENMTNVMGAQDTDAFGRKVGMFRQVPELAAVRSSQMGAATRQLSSQAGIYAAAADALEQDTLGRIEQRVGPAAASLARGFSYVERWLYGDKAYVQDYREGASPAVRQVVDDTLAAAADKLMSASQRLDEAAANTSNTARQRAAVAVQPE